MISCVKHDNTGQSIHQQLTDLFLIMNMWVWSGLFSTTP